MVVELSARMEVKCNASQESLALMREDGPEGPSLELNDSSASSQTASTVANKPGSVVVTVCVCLVFTAVGPILILTNKYLISRCKFPYPILLTCSGQISSSVICFFLVRVCKVVPLTPMPWPVYVRNVSAVGLVACLAMALGNSTYLYLTVSFIEILKGFTPVVTIMVQAVFGQAFPRPIAGVAVLMILVGTSISSFGEIDLNLLGVSLMLGSIYCEAMRLMLTQRLLQDMRMHVLETLYYLSPATLLWLLPLAYVVDVRRMDVSAVIAELPHSWPFFVLSTLTGLPAREKRPNLGGARARLPRRLRARLAALSGAALPGGESGPRGARPLPRVLERAASKVADSTGLWPCRPPTTHSCGLHSTWLQPPLHVGCMQPPG